MTSRFDRAFRKFAITVLGVYARLRFNTHKIVTDEPPKGALILCNHTMLMDFANLLWAMFPRSDQRFVATSVVYDRSKLNQWAFKHLGLIRKNQGATDLTSLKEMMKAAKEGGSVVIYAAGMLSFDGRPAIDVLPGTETLPRLMRTDVYAAVTHGGFLTSPRYSHKVSRGRIEIELKRICTAQEAASLSKEELRQRINEALSFNDWDWQEAHRVPFHGIKSVKKLSRTLYMCPACHGEGTLLEKGNTLTCSRCGLSARRDKYGFFSSENPACPTRVDKWADLEREEIKRQLESEDFALRAPVTLYERQQNSSEDLHCAGTGELTMDRESLRFEGKESSLCFGFSDFQFLMLDDVNSLIINTDKKNYRFAFDDPRLVTKWFFVHRELRGL
ncbi:MAG: 1-acyl-sn-glycerol-3-phosphate acyltransferase [Clostridia bacterium]|nr:1-acyl-sn-glycerol-3-phosphate acyltransferase [Clostridia bacterium]